MSNPFIKLIPDTKFVVDGFTIKDKSDKIWFLSHFHSDHYNGLSVRKWKHGTICKFKINLILDCSQITKNMIELKFTKENDIKVLEIGKTYEIEGTKVTPFDANHCPGALCFLFELKNGKRIFHAGDFRFEKDKFIKNEKIQEIKDQLDVVYLDTTYCNPEYQFSKQSECLEILSKTIFQKMKDNSKSLILVGTYTIGKERILESISKECKCKVFAPLEKYEILSKLELEYFNIFTTNPQETNIHLVSMFDLGWKKLLEIKKFYSDKEIIAIKPTGWTESKNELKITSNKNYTLIECPYSEHSSFDELRDFCEYFNPKEIIPTVNFNESEKQIYYLKEYEYKRRDIQFKLPDLLKKSKSILEYTIDYSKSLIDLTSNLLFSPTSENKKRKVVEKKRVSISQKNTLDNYFKKL